MHSSSDSIEEFFRADLHCHTTSSDGSMSSREIIDLAVEVGLQGLAITDHDTIDAYQTAPAYAKEKGLLLGTGVEFSCSFKGESVHVLGYDFSLNHAGFSEYCLRQQSRRKERNQEILERLQGVKIAIEEKDLLSLHSTVSTLGRPHIAAAMVQKGYVKTIQEAFHFYLGDGKRCYVPGKPFSIGEAIEIIHEAGGKAFIAHPHLYRDATRVREILAFSFDGIECFYGRSTAGQVKRWKKMAEHRGLLISGGSDFHGKSKPYLSLGRSWVDREIFFSIFEKNLLCP